MIRVICLNPVIDRMYYIDDFCAATKFYEVPPKVYVGGKGINIARVMSLMGEHCVLYGFLGGGNGRLVSEDMKGYDVEFKARTGRKPRLRNPAQRSAGKRNGNFWKRWRRMYAKEIW